MTRKADEQTSTALVKMADGSNGQPHLVRDEAAEAWSNLFEIAHAGPQSAILRPLTVRAKQGVSILPFLMDQQRSKRKP